MGSITQKLQQAGVISPPSFLPHNVVYEALMGSYAYGASTDDSDRDVYGVCIPDKLTLFPHLAGEIQGFGRQIKRFEQFQQHHVQHGDKQYDIQIYNIVKYFQLLLDNNPSVLDSLFVPFNCVLFTSQVGNMIRESRKMFLHKGAFHRYKGYAYSQMHKMSSIERTGKRKEICDKHGWDVKFGMHLVRLLDYIEQILTTGDLDMQRNSEQLKAIRRGEVSEEEVRKWASEKELQLEKMYAESKLPWGPDEAAIKQLLLNCLELHYGSLADCVSKPNAEKQALLEIQQVLDKYQNNAVTV